LRTRKVFYGVLCAGAEEIFVVREFFVFFVIASAIIKKDKLIFVLSVVFVFILNRKHQGFNLLLKVKFPR